MPNAANPTSEERSSANAASSASSDAAGLFAPPAVRSDGPARPDAAAQPWLLAADEAAAAAAADAGDMFAPVTMDAGPILPPSPPRASAPQAEVPRRPQSQSIEAKFHEAAALLSAGRVAVRPSQLFDGQCVAAMTFLEQPIIKRRKGDDRWVTSGGRKGATAVWLTSDMGILKRYGRVVRGDGKHDLKFAQFSVLTPGRTADDETVDDKSKALWLVQPLDNPKPTHAILAGARAVKQQTDAGRAAALAPAGAAPPSRLRAARPVQHGHRARRQHRILSAAWRDRQSTTGSPVQGLCRRSRRGVPGAAGTPAEEGLR